MITSIVVTGEYNIGMNSNKKIKIDEHVLSVEKDIPFIRYRLDTYSESTLTYIEKMMQQFNLSTHLVEIKLNENTSNVLEMLNSKFSNIAKYIYLDITEEEVQNRKIDDTKISLLSQTLTYGIDRYMLKDKSTSLDTILAKSFIKEISKTYDIREDMIGICSSPLSFSDLACLTSVKARELMSLYSSVADVALPSANHQCMNCCGCIRYIVVNSDTAAPADSKAFGGTKKEKSESTENKEKTVSKPKVKNVINLGIYNL